MELLFLGTGAADRMALEQEDNFLDKDKRRCAAALLNGSILLDCGPHILNSLSVANIDLSSITDIVITHFHSDHFDLSSIKTIASAADRPVRLWYRSDALVPEECKKVCEMHPMEPFCEYDVKDSIKITGVPANHEAFPQHLSVIDEKGAFFYGMDGAWFLGDTVRFMQNKCYKTVILDATVGDYLGDYRIGEHNSIPMIRALIPSFKTLDIIDDDTNIVLSHIAVCLHKPHEEICKCVADDGFTVAYDGLKITI